MFPCFIPDMQCLHHSLDPQSSSSLEISLPEFTIARISHFDHMASFGCLTFHLLAHEFVPSLHLTIIDCLVLLFNLLLYLISHLIYSFIIFLVSILFFLFI